MISFRDNLLNFHTLLGPHPVAVLITFLPSKYRGTMGVYAVLPDSYFISIRKQHSDFKTQKF